MRGRRGTTKRPMTRSLSRRGKTGIRYLRNPANGFRNIRRRGMIELVTDQDLYLTRRCGLKQSVVFIIGY